MKKIIGLTLAVLLIIGLIGGGTYALFTDTQTSTGNTFTAGTLTLTPATTGTSTATTVVTTGGHGINGKVVFTLLKPTDSGTISWTLSNTGNLPGTLTMASTVTGTLTTLDAGADVMVWVTRGGADILGVTGTYVSISGLAAALNAESQSIAGAGSLVYVIHWQIPSSVGNDIQGATADISVTFTLTQS